jgi:antirestriction protein ArdC
MKFRGNAAPKVDLYQAVTDRIVAHLEEVLASGEKWERPYLPSPQVQPLNVEGRPYRGVNWWLLATADAPSGCWATYRMWDERGAQVRKGERGTQVVFWKPMVGKPKPGEEVSAEEAAKAARGKPWMLLKHFVVFSAEQVEGFDLEAWAARWRPATHLLGAPRPGVFEFHPVAEPALRDYHARVGLALTEGAAGPPAYYPAADRIGLPPRQTFLSQGGYYGSWAHEAVHSTGRQDRLDRQMGKRFGDQAYAVEELVAELGAAMFCAATGVQSECRKDHACYLAHWIGVLKTDKRAIFTVASKSQAAVDLILLEIDTVDGAGPTPEITDTAAAAA